MKTISLLAFFIFSVSVSGFGQSDPCDCKLAYDALLKSIDQNYIALKIPSNRKLKERFEKKRAQLLNVIFKVAPEDCTRTLMGFLRTLEDDHVFVIEQPKYTPAEIAAVRASIKKEKLALEEIKQAVLKRSGSAIQGEWTDGRSIYAIFGDGKQSTAYILRSQDTAVSAGQKIAEFSRTDFGYDVKTYFRYSPKSVNASVYKQDSVMYITGGRYWKRMSGFFTNPNIAVEDPALPKITKLNDRSVLFTIPSFSIDGNIFNKHVMDNIQKILDAENVIFDIRGNTGGGALYLSFLDIYAKQALPASQGLVLASDDNKSYFEQNAKYSPDIFGPVVERIASNPGKIVDGPLYPERKFETVKSNIKNVAILVDQGCMSASESFVIHSKQVNPKITVFGEPTAGCIDYTSVNVVPLPSGTRNISFGYPTSTLHKSIPNDGYNKTGIVPDVKIGNNVKDQVKFIADYYAAKSQN